MNRTELKEIKKLFTLKGCCVHRLYGCYVDSEKNIRFQWEHPFLSLPEDELILYLNLLRKPLSAGFGKNLVNAGLDINGKGHLLANMRHEDAEDRKAFYDQVINELEYTGHFAILLAAGTYDVPGKASDGEELEDSEDIYNFVLACICPVPLQKPGLVYDTEDGAFTNLVTSRMLQDPQIGILYPAFNDRSADINACLCYSKSMKESERTFLENQTGSRLPMPMAEGREAYKNILEKTLGNKCTLEEVRKIEDELRHLKEFPFVNMEFNEITELGEQDIQDLMRRAGIDKQRRESLSKVYVAEIGSEKLNLDHLGNLRAFTVVTEDGRLSLDPRAASLVSIRHIDGKPMLTLDLEGQDYVMVNGIKIGI